MKMRTGILRKPPGFLRTFFAKNGTLPVELEVLIMHAQRLQVWFQHNRGLAMTKRHCVACGTDRLFTIWLDGNYHCLYCLYGQVNRGEDGPVQITPPLPKMREFAQLWLSYRRCTRALDDGWLLEEEKAVPKAGERLAPPAPPVCIAEDCATCGSCRPHVPHPSGEPHCFHCLMKQGLQTVPSAQPKRPTVERLNEAARAAVASMYKVG